ncbi:MAG: AmmeMemoRadiSam system radical SAM enzyme [Chloroflexota bacterium]|nr:AmmeMemoRadiSam system radical SAM enzyme [Chloroflexota bacterium]
MEKELRKQVLELQERLGQGRITRREFLRCVTLLGLSLAAAKVLAACRPAPSPTPTSAPPTPEEKGTEAAPEEAEVPSAYVHEAMWYTPLSDNRVQCQLCPNRCLSQEGQRGICEVRENRGGKLYTLVYGNPCAVHIDPIEKKPFNHFLPATIALSLATVGCNFDCAYCQNWQISQARPEEVKGYDLPPEKVVETALEKDCQSIAYTYTEPTIFYEYMLDTAKLARAKGLRNVIITNGFINPEPLRELCQYVDGIRVDLKAFDEEFYIKVSQGRLEPVLETLKIIQEEGVHLEIINLVVPTLNDDPEEIRQMCQWIKENLGLDVPLHFSRFLPMYKLQSLPPTPIETLETAHKIALEEGLHYVYIGNVPGHPAENTYCSKCGELLIKRRGFYVLENHIIDGKCEYCGEPIPGVWE